MNGNVVINIPGASAWTRALSIAILALTQDVSPFVGNARSQEEAVETIDFRSQVAPIFEAHCLKCHGDIRPKGDFRLTGREAALTSGAYGKNIVVGDADESFLVEAIEREDEDIAMPPEEENNPVPPESVAIIRAWIDQGAVWDEEPTRRAEFSMQSRWRLYSINGNESKFRETLNVAGDGAFGVTDFGFLVDTSDRGTLEVGGSVWDDPNRYDVELTYNRRDLGYLRAGASNFRTYDNLLGEVYGPFDLQGFTLGRALERDHQRAFVDIGIQVPDLPEFTIGYDYFGVDGAKSLLEYGTYAETVDGDFVSRAIRPSYKLQDHERHRLELGVKGTLGGVLIEDSAQINWVDLDSFRVSDSSFSPGVVEAEQSTEIRDRFDYRQTANTIRFEKQAKPWLFVSGGHLYSNLNGQGTFSQTTLSPTGAFGAFEGPIGQSLTLDQHSQVMNANASFGPWEGWTLTSGFQGEWLRQLGQGVVINFPGGPAEASRSRYEEFRAQEKILARYTKLKDSVVYFEGNFIQEGGEQRESLENGLFRITDSDNLTREAVAGFEYSPRRWVSLNIKGRHRQRRNDYDHLADTSFGAPDDGYPAYILDRDERLDEIKTRLSLRPHRQIKTTVSYQYEDRDYENTTVADSFTGSPGGELRTADQRAHVAGASISYNPIPRLSLHSYATYWNSRIRTEDQGALAVVPFKGDVYSVSSGLTYSLDKKSDLTLSYAISEADYGQSNVDYTVPAGTEFRWSRLRSRVNRRFSKNVIAGLEYAYYDYEDPAALSLSDFDGHGVFVTMEWRMSASY